MANLDQYFDIVGTIHPKDAAGIFKALEGLNGVNQVKIDNQQNKVIVSYTPGIINIQNIKETIESQGLDVSDRGHE